MSMALTKVMEKRFQKVCHWDKIMASLKKSLLEHWKAILLDIKQEHNPLPDKFYKESNTYI